MATSKDKSIKSFKLGSISIDAKSLLINIRQSNKNPPKN